MTESEQSSQQSAISREFSARLDQLKPKQKIRAIVLLRTRDTGPTSTRRPNRLARQAAIKTIRQSTTQALGDIDAILQQFDGTRLAQTPDALGSIPIETTSPGIKALANSPHVKAILEDQPIFLAR